MRHCILITVLSICSIVAYGQKKKKNLGKFNGSVESNMGYYIKDSKLGANDVENKFAINTYLNLGYTINNFNFGLQYELYEPPLLGYYQELKGNKLIQGFAEYNHSNFSLRLGNMYGQFGNGLIFRAFEDRNIGFNNSLFGFSSTVQAFNALRLKFILGMPRKFLEYSNSRIYGVDVEYSITDMLELDSDTYLNLGFSWVLRDDHEKDRLEAPATVNSYSGRIDFSKGIFSTNIEFVSKSNALSYNPLKGYDTAKGSALLVNMSANFSGIGLSTEFRRLENMDFRIDDRTDISNMNINYIPALTKQHKYALMALSPHEVHSNGEIGGQFDLFGELSFDAISDMPIYFNINGSIYHNLKENDGKTKFLSMDGSLLFREINIELEKSWLSNNFKTILSYAHQTKPEFSRYGYGEMKVNSNILVADILYRFSKKHSLRMELQHLQSNSKDDKAWVLGLLEYSFVPSIMFHVSDMYNYDTSGTKIHYYSVGGSYAWKNLRASLNYGRNRAGIQCSGGVCRYVPEYTGFNLLFTLIF